ncbi:uncharacterized protein LOC123987754 [Osmia bicornis bicornis]|uniref:uncharacterized protein LOC123987754 n=1 Tax=Osmia bicornis bicornis TaxID=1437191 RepID=UPI001EAF0592|nr:uncharacterized protein LOC123987754 [Osmia bicornis bicornis]
MFFRCKLWLQACGREDLPSSEYQHYHKTRRVCSNHFENRMYMGPSKSRLLPTAIPKQIESDTNIQEESGNNPEFQPPAKIRVVDIAAISGPSHQGNITPIGFDASVQTPASISAGTPRKRKLENEMCNLERENLELKAEVLELRDNQSSLSTFQGLCKKFLSPKIVNLVNMQVLQNNRNVHGRLFRRRGCYRGI